MKNITYFNSPDTSRMHTVDVYCAQLETLQDTKAE